MTTIADEISPASYGESRIDLQLAEATVTPKSGQPVVVNVDATRALPEGLQLPLEFTVASPSGASVFHRQVFRRFVPSTLSFRPSEGGSVLVRLAELHHNRWFGALAVDVQGNAIERAPRRNPRALPSPAAAVMPTLSFVRSLDFVSATDSRVTLPLGTRNIDDPLTTAVWAYIPTGACTILGAGQFGTYGWQISVDSGGTFHAQIRKSGGSETLAISGGTRTVDAWHHLLLTYGGDAATLELYVNNSLVSSVDSDTLTAGGTIFHESIPGPNAGWTYGSHNTTAPFTGRLYNAAWYARYFSAADVALDYNGGIAMLDRSKVPTYADRIAWHPPLDTDTDPDVQVTDLSGNANHGVGTNMAFALDTP